jgi:hypothetical protein
MLDSIGKCIFDNLYNSHKNKQLYYSISNKNHNGSIIIDDFSFVYEINDNNNNCCLNFFHNNASRKYKMCYLSIDNYLESKSQFDSVLSSIQFIIYNDNSIIFNGNLLYFPKQDKWTWFDKNINCSLEQCISNTSTFSPITPTLQIEIGNILIKCLQNYNLLKQEELLAIEHNINEINKILDIITNNDQETVYSNQSIVDNIMKQINVINNNFQLNISKNKEFEKTINNYEENIINILLEAKNIGYNFHNNILLDKIKSSLPEPSYINILNKYNL